MPVSAGVSALGWAVFVLGAVVPVYIAFGLIGLSGMREITRYETHDSLYYRLNPVTKIVALFMVAVSSTFATLYLGLLGTITILASYATLKDGREKLKMGALFTTAVVWGTAWGEVSRRLSFVMESGSSGAAPVIYEGLARSVASEVSVSGVFLLALILVMTSTPSAMMRALRRLGIPNPITFSVVVGMRTVPSLLEAINGIVRVQLMRGLGSRGSRTLAPLYTVVAILFALIPALIYLLRGARNTAISTGTRAFGAYKNRTYIGKQPFGAADLVVLALAASFLAAAVVL